jgi:translation initiation factor IF-3
LTIWKNVEAVKPRDLTVETKFVKSQDCLDYNDGPAVGAGAVFVWDLNDATRVRPNVVRPPTHVPEEDAIGPNDRNERNAPVERGMRVNEQIRISPVRVINFDGAMLGVMPTGKALEAAREAGADLVEVAPNERPPVCKIMDFGKFKYSQKKRAAKQKQHQVQVKEIRVRPKTGDHDIEVKVKRAREFLEHKDKVLVNVLFRGRELAHIDEGRKVMLEVLALLEDVAKLEKPPSMEGKRMTAIIAPRA